VNRYRLVLTSCSPTTSRCRARHHSVRRFGGVNLNLDNLISWCTSNRTHPTLTSKLGNPVPKSSIGVWCQSAEKKLCSRVSLLNLWAWQILGFLNPAAQQWPYSLSVEWNIAVWLHQWWLEWKSLKKRVYSSNGFLTNIEFLWAHVIFIFFDEKLWKLQNLV